MAAHTRSWVLLFACVCSLTACGYFGGQSALLWPLVEQWVTPTATSGTPALPAAAAPTMNPADGTYSADQNVALASSTVGADIRYTTDGSDPTETSAVYSAPISVAGNGTAMTIKAIATKSGMSDSAIVASAYTINYSQVSTPAMSPTGGTYNSDQSITITCATGGATIHYTDNGTPPTAASPTYVGPIPVGGTGTHTIKAIAILGGMTDSTIRTEVYTIQDATAPAPGGSGTITPSAVTDASLTLTWTAATDDYTVQTSLQYRVYQSSSNDIGSVATAASPTGMIQDWTANIHTLNVSGLAPTTTYYFNVFVKDAAGNISAYTIVSQTTAAAVAPTDYVAWYKFSGNYNDSSGHGLNLNPSSNAPVGTTDRGMTLGNAYSFNAAQANSLSLSTNSLNFASDVSVSYWVNISSFAADGHHICKADASYGYCLGHTSSGDLRGDYWDANTDDNFFNTVALTAGTWTHIVITVKSGIGGRSRIYKNGALQLDLPWPDAHTLGVTANPFYIAADKWGTADFTGAMDDIRIYSRELTAGEVSALYSLSPD